MADERAEASAESLYREARARWVKIVDLSIYDDKKVIDPTVDLLEQARELDPRHVRARVLLSDLYMELKADGEASDVVDELIGLEPRNPTHREKRKLIRAVQADRNEDTIDDMRAFAEDRWTSTEDW